VSFAASSDGLGGQRLAPHPGRDDAPETRVWSN